MERQPSRRRQELGRPSGTVNQGKPNDKLTDLVHSKQEEHGENLAQHGVWGTVVNVQTRRRELLATTYGTLSDVPLIMSSL